VTEPAAAEDTATERGPYSEPSPSAIELVSLCDARFGAKYIARLTDPQGAKAALGTRCHSIAEAYQRDGTAPNRAETFEIIKYGTPKTYYPGRIVSNILHHLPPAGTTPNVEGRMSFVHRGITFNGRIDWQNETTIGDHKFTSNPYGSWVKTPDKLTRDPQRIMYSHDWFARHDADTVTAQWTYGDFNAKSSRVIKVEGSRVEIRNLLDEVVMPAAEKLLRYVSDQRDWNSLPKNTTACGTFPPNGCPYAAQCTRTKQQRIEGLMTSPYLLKIRAQKAAADAKAAAAVAPTPAQAPANDVPSADVETDEADAKVAIVGAINPPGEAADAPLDAPESKPSAPSEAPKRGRGRPPKAKVEAPGAAETQPAAAQSADTKKSLVLLINTIAMRGMPDVIFASDLIAQANNHIKSSYDVLDYRAGGNDAVDYGKGAGLLAACIVGLIEDLPADSVVYLDTTSPEGSLALQPLMAAATTVLRGN